MTRAFRRFWTIGCTAGMLFLFVSCGGGAQQQEQGFLPDQPSPQGEIEVDLRTAYCSALKMLYGGGIDCMDGGRAFLDKSLSEVAGVVFDSDYLVRGKQRRYLLCLREPLTEDGAMATLDAIVVEKQDGDWARVAGQKNIVQAPFLDQLVPVSTVGAPVVRATYRDPDGLTAAVYIDFREERISLPDSFSPMPPAAPLPRCVADPAQVAGLPASGSGAELLTTAFERYLMAGFELVDEEKMPVPVAEDSIVRVYQRENVLVTCIQVIDPNGEVTWCRIEGDPVCEDGLEGLFRLLQELYPRLRPFSLETRSIFAVLMDHVDFQVVREGEELRKISYDSFLEGQEAHIELRKADEDIVLEFRFYRL